MAEAAKPPATAADSGSWPVPAVSESDMWAAELAFLPAGDTRSRKVQFAIRTAIRAQELAHLAGTRAIDELLDARAVAVNPASRTIYETAIGYLAREQELQLGCWWPAAS